MLVTVIEKEQLGQISLDYPRKWIVVYDIEDRTKYIIDEDGMFPLKSSWGMVYGVYDTSDEAFAVWNSLDSSYGRTFVQEGFDDRPQMEGLYELN